MIYYENKISVHVLLIYRTSEISEVNDMLELKSTVLSEVSINKN